MVGRLLHDVDAPPISDPFGELLRLAAIVRTAADVAGERLNVLSSFRFTDDKGAEQVRSEVMVWRELLGLAQRTLTDVVKLDIEARHLRLEEAKVTLVAAALGTALASVDVTDVQIYAIRQAFAAALEAGA